MTKFEVAHNREQGVDLVIVVVGDSFGDKTQREQRQSTNSLQMCASSAGLAGMVVSVWDTGDGRMGFLAPPNYHPFFRSIDWNFIARHINRELTCD